MKYKVRVSPELLETMTLAAIEAYCYGNLRKLKNTAVETLGYVWGYRKQENGTTIFYLDRTSVSISAERQYHSVTPNLDAAKLKNEVMMRWSPHLTMLGDFHSHPYRNLKEVNAESGYNFSPEDLNELKTNDFIWEQSGNNPVILVIAVCRLGRVRDSVQDNFRNNTARYAVGEFQFWLNGAVGYLDAEGRRLVTGNTSPEVQLSVEGWYFNKAGGRVRVPSPAETLSRAGQLLKPQRGPQRVQ
jgi:hypothetical protein